MAKSQTKKNAQLFGARSEESKSWFDGGRVCCGSGSLSAEKFWSRRLGAAKLRFSGNVFKVFAPYQAGQWVSQDLGDGFGFDILSFDAR